MQMDEDFGALEEVLNAQQEHASQFGGGSESFMKEVYGLIGEEALLMRFVGGVGEPHKIPYHTLSPHGGNQYGERFICLGAGCPACVKASIKGEKRVSKVSLWAAFTVYSCRPMFLIPTQKQDGTTYNKREPFRRNTDGYAIMKLDGGGTAFYPNGVHPHVGKFNWEEEGIRVWKGSMSSKVQNAARIAALIADLKTRCRCDKSTGAGMSMAKARVQVHSTTCGNCGNPVAAAVVGQTIVCASCGSGGKHDEHLVCTAQCGNPQRASLRDCYVQVKRIGNDNKTVYEFTALPFSQPEQHHMEHLYRQENNVWVPNGLPLAEIYKSNEKALRDAMAARGLVDVAMAQVPGTMPGTMSGGFPPQGGMQPGVNPFSGAGGQPGGFPGGMPGSPPPMSGGPGGAPKPNFPTFQGSAPAPTPSPGGPFGGGPPQPSGPAPSFSGGPPAPSVGGPPPAPTPSTPQGGPPAPTPGSLPKLTFKGL